MSTNVTVSRECEYRFEVSANDTYTIKLESGSAEIFGTELAIGREYQFQDQKLAVYTWYGCTLCVSGKADVAYVSDETPMSSLVNIHAQLEKRRDYAMLQKKAGPRVLVTGPGDSGKTTVSQILLNYALRMERYPILVDLDPGMGWQSIPGNIAATPLDINCLNVQESFILTNCIGFFYGHTSISENLELYRHFIQRLAQAIQSRLTNNENANSSGIVIDTSNWIDGAGYDLLLFIIEQFQINVVIVIGQDRLFSRLQSISNASVIKIARSGGVVPFNNKQKVTKRMSQIRRYFYGQSSPLNDIPLLSPCINEYSFQDLDLFTIREIKVSDVMLPVGQSENNFQRLQVVLLEKSMDLLNSIAAVCHEPEQEVEAQESKAGHAALLHTATAGFVCIKEIHMDKEKIVLLVPSPGPLPSRMLLFGSIRWME